GTRGGGGRVSWVIVRGGAPGAGPSSGTGLNDGLGLESRTRQRGGRALAPQLKGFVYPNDGRGDERQAEHGRPLPAGERRGVQQALEHMELNRGPGQDPAQDDPA